jgi:uncharacterized membrane protein
MNNFTIGIIIVGFLLLDVAWISSNKATYNKLVEGVQNDKMVVKIVPAMVAYFLMVLGYIAILLPLLKQEGVRNKNVIQLFVIALRYGGIFGLVVYGIYNATNMAIFKGYSTSIAIKDTIWGTSVYTILCFVTLLVVRYYRN